MRLFLTLAATAAALAVAAVASAGGWATVQLSSTPTGIEPGGTWSVDLTVLQHGKTRLDGVHPEVRISGAGTRLAYPAAPTGRAGEYHAEVVFPEAGTWRLAIWDGFSRTHTYAPVAVGGDGGGGGALAPWLVALAGAGGLAAVGLAALVVRSRRRPGEEPLAV